MFFNGLKPKQENCCGCEGCKSICPKSAISITTDDAGFIMPEVNTELCVECGLCEKVCPMLNSDKAIFSKLGEAFAAVNKNQKDLSESSSGGIFSVIADYVLERGGAVCGASFDNDLILRHTIIFSKQKMAELRGSKYLQSRTGNVYEEIRDLLKDGKMVYYVGTGCQVAGLKLFLRKAYDNLLTSDILCHGVPPQSVFDKIIRIVESKHTGRIIKYNFRDKSVWGWSCSSSSIISKGDKFSYLGNEPLQQAYFNAFIKGDNYRESCYVCPYACSTRSGDITLGDYWGVEKYLKVPNIRGGVSALIVNSEKGRCILNEVGMEMNLYPARIEDIKIINKTLVSPTPRPSARNSFFLKFKQNPEKMLMTYFHPNHKRDLIYRLKRNRITAKLISSLKVILHR